MGLLWAGFYGPGEYAASATAAATAVLPFAMRYATLSVLSFGAFFGMYSGLLCRAERVFGENSPVSSVIAGGALGTAIGVCLPPRGQNAVMIGSMTGIVSGVTAAMVQQRR